MLGTYPVQTKHFVQIRANLLKKVSKNSEKIMNVLLSLPHLYIKFHGRIILTLEVTKKTNFKCTPNLSFFNFQGKMNLTMKFYI